MGVRRTQTTQSYVGHLTTTRSQQERKRKQMKLTVIPLDVPASLLVSMAALLARSST